MAIALRVPQLRRPPAHLKADIAAASIRCNKPGREIADDLMASGPYRIASHNKNKPHGRNR
jgi:hypothetical protein